MWRPRRRSREPSVAALASRLELLLDGKQYKQKAADPDVWLRHLLQAAALEIVIGLPDLPAIDWIDGCRAVIDDAVAADNEDRLAFLKLAVWAATAGSPGGATAEDLAAIQHEFEAVVATLKRLGARDALGIAHLVLGHCYLTHRPFGPRYRLLDDAAACFAAAEQVQCSPLVRATAKLRRGEAELIMISSRNVANVKEAHDTTTAALKIVSSNYDPSRQAAARRLAAQACTGIGFAERLLSTTGTDAQQEEQLRAAIQSLDSARRLGGLPRGGERWAKMMLTLAHAVDDLLRRYGLCSRRLSKYSRRTPAR